MDSALAESGRLAVSMKVFAAAAQAGSSTLFPDLAASPKATMKALPEMRPALSTELPARIPSMYALPETAQGLPSLRPGQLSTKARADSKIASALPEAYASLKATSEAAQALP